MVSVVIPTSNSAATLPAALSALVPAAADGLVREVILVDHASSDQTFAIADAMGCEVINGPVARGERLLVGARKARCSALLFLHADSVLASGFEREVRHCLETWESQGRFDRQAAVFRTLHEGYGLRPRLSERMADLRASVLGLAYGESGLLISRRFYDALGGHRPLALMEDVDLTRRIGPRRLVTLRSGAYAIAGAREPETPLRAQRRRHLIPWLLGVRSERLSG
jgi:glycosyltransferase involved in cell wall biosynthesis